MEREKTPGADRSFYLGEGPWLFAVDPVSCMIKQPLENRVFSDGIFFPACQVSSIPRHIPCFLKACSHASTKEGRAPEASSEPQACSVLLAFIKCHLGFCSRHPVVLRDSHQDSNLRSVLYVYDHVYIYIVYICVYIYAYV